MKKLRILIYDTMRFFHSDIETLTEIEIFDLKQQLLILEVEEEENIGEHSKSSKIHQSNFRCFWMPEFCQILNPHKRTSRTLF